MSLEDKYFLRSSVLLIFFLNIFQCNFILIHLLPTQHSDIVCCLQHITPRYHRKFKDQTSVFKGLKYILFSNLKHMCSSVYPRPTGPPASVSVYIPDSKCINSHTDLFEESIIEQLSFFLPSFLGSHMQTCLHQVQCQQYEML